MPGGVCTTGVIGRSTSCLELTKEVVFHFADAGAAGMFRLKGRGVGGSHGLGAGGIDGVHEVLGLERGVIVIDSDTVGWRVDCWLVVREWTHGGKEHVVLARPNARMLLVWP